MLDAGHDGIVLCKICTLVTSYHCPCNLRTKVRVFTTSFRNTSPTRITGNIYHRRERPANSICTGFSGSYPRRFFYSIHVPGTSQSQRDREGRLVAMDDIHSKNEGDLQAAIFYCHSLHFTYLFYSFNIEQSTYFASLDLAGNIRTAGLASGNISCPW